MTTCFNVLLPTQWAFTSDRYPDLIVRATMTALHISTSILILPSFEVRPWKNSLLGALSSKDILLLLTSVWIALSSWQKLSEILRPNRQQKDYEIVPPLIISNQMHAEPDLDYLPWICSHIDHNLFSSSVPSNFQLICRISSNPSSIVGSSYCSRKLVNAPKGSRSLRAFQVLLTQSYLLGKICLPLSQWLM